MADKPTLPEVLRVWLEAQSAELHTALPGKVKSYDRATQTAEVIPIIKQATPRKDGSVDETALAVIPNVRVLWPRAGGAYLHLPMQAGDYVLLVFNEAAIGHWRETGQVPAPPGDLTRHSISYPYAIPGGWPDAGAFELPPPTSESYTDSVLMVPGVLRVVKSADPSDQFVAGGEKVNTEFTNLRSHLDTLLGHLLTFLGTFAADSATLTPVAPTVLSGAATAIGAITAFQGVLDSTWPSATVEMTAVKVE